MPLCDTPKTSENFLLSSGSAKREYWPNKDNHGIMLQQLQNNKYEYDMKNKYISFKRPQLLYDGGNHYTENQSINLP